MRTTTDDLARALGKRLTTAWLLCGDEPLLVGEAADAIRARARAEGFVILWIFATNACQIHACAARACYETRVGHDRAA